MAWIKPLIVLVLLAIVVSLGSALFSLLRGRGNSRSMVRALTVRIGLSIGLLLFIILAAYLGWITPHGLGSAPAPGGS
ncbi:MAG: twin transmembrane helix small protein [Candidatus Competibacterales bacterium]|nr:twin transmembrane helix small protein [Candidatus Competibacterales bacterium]